MSSNSNYLITRTIYEYLQQDLANSKILILIGARQVGKTHLLLELKQFIEDKAKRAKYFNLEIPKDSRYFSQDLVELYEDITDNVDYIFIDEFQYFNNASKFFKAIYDDPSKDIKIIASGSSSLEIHKHLKESLAGRKNQEIIYPLNFNEYSQINNSLADYFLYGALPALINIKDEANKIKELQNLLATYILKDIKSLIAEQNVPAFNKLLYLLAARQGQIIAIASLANELKISAKELENYLYVLEETFVLYSLHSYAKNLSNELKKSKKYYLYDSGIRNMILSDFKSIELRDDKGLIHETYVHNFLYTQLPPNAELRFWRTKKGDEIDFVYIKNQLPYIFEVKSNLKVANIPKSFEKFISAYPKTQKGFIINENLNTTLDYHGICVEFISFDQLEFINLDIF
jgi:predicted AAA+ superfamily ATPase